MNEFVRQRLFLFLLNVVLRLVFLVVVQFLFLLKILVLLLVDGGRALESAIITVFNFLLDGFCAVENAIFFSVYRVT